MDGADGIDRGAGERAVYPARAGASGGGSKNEKSPVTGLDIAACGVGGGSQTSHPQAACPAAPSATIRLFRQLGGHMDLVAGVRFGNVIGSALFFRNGCDFRFCAVECLLSRSPDERS